MIAIKTFHQRQNIANCLHFSPPLTFDIQGIFITFALKCSVFGSDHLSPVQVQISSTCILVSCLPLSDIPGVFITYLRKCSVFGSDHLSSVWISSINILGYISLVFQAYLLIWIIFWASTSSDILYQYPCLYIQYSWCICHFLGKCSVFGSDNLSLVQISCISIPVYTSIFQAYLSLVRAMEWTDYLVLYEDNEGLVSVWTIRAQDDNKRILTITMILRSAYRSCSSIRARQRQRMSRWPSGNFCQARETITGIHPSRQKDEGFLAPSDL